MDADDRRVEPRDRETQARADVGTESAQAQRLRRRLTGVEKDRRSRLDDLQQLATEEETLLHIEENPPPAFEREVRIGTQSVLPVREKLQVAVEIGAGIDAKARDEGERIRGRPSPDHPRVVRENRVAVYRTCARRRAESRQHERARSEGVACRLIAANAPDVLRRAADAERRARAEVE